MFNLEKVKGDYPKAYKELFNYYSSQVSNLRGMPGVQELISEEQMKPLVDAAISMLFKNPANIRSLYEWFDSKNIFIGIEFIGNLVTCIVNDIDLETMRNRIEAESCGFEYAFSILEKNL